MADSKSTAALHVLYATAKDKTAKVAALVTVCRMLLQDSEAATTVCDLLGQIKYEFEDMMGDIDLAMDANT